VAARGAATVLDVRRPLLLVPFALTFALTATGCGGGGSPATKTTASKFRGGELHPTIAPANFILRDQSGELVSLAGQRGHFAIVTFLYTNCPDVCPLIASNLGQVQRRLAADGTKVSVLGVSVDPKRDTPAAVRQFLRSHRLSPDFHYLTGTRAQLAKVWKAYGILVRPGKLDTVDHAAYEMLVDPKGRARLIYNPMVKAADIVHDVRELLS
jgi:protein SCO1/2